MSGFKFSKRSLDNLVGVHPRLVDTAHDVIKCGVADFSVNEGLRTYERQAQLFKDGKTKTMRSKHLQHGDGYAHAIDVYPSPIDMKKVIAGDEREIVRFGVLYGAFYVYGLKNGIELTWGGDWDNDGQTLDHTFFDAPHIEIKRVL